MSEENAPTAQHPAVQARTPPDALMKVDFKRVVRGYDPDEVDASFERVRESYEAMWRERSNHEVEVRDLQEEVARLKQEQDMVRDLLISAKRMAAEIEGASHEEAERVRAKAQRMLDDAQERADEIVRVAAARAEELLTSAKAQADALTQQSIIDAEERTRSDRAEAAAREKEIERLTGLDREMRAGYRGFLLAAIELLDSHPSPSAGREAAARPAEASGGPAEASPEPEVEEQPVAAEPEVEAAAEPEVVPVAGENGAAAPDEEAASAQSGETVVSAVTAVQAARSG